MHYIYILQSSRDHKYYTGSTNNIKRRLEQHNQGLVKSTQNRRPLKLVHTENFDTKKEAQKREKFLKSGQGREKIKQLFKIIE